jgi:hypothetical protein
MSKVGNETRLICATGKSNGYPDGFNPNINCTLISGHNLVNLGNHLLIGHSQLLPLRMILSKTATRLEITWSTSSSPARTVITSELGLVYFFFSTHAKKTVKVWLRH